jgi:hypothetical protein
MISTKCYYVPYRTLLFVSEASLTEWPFLAIATHEQDRIPERVEKARKDVLKKIFV